MEVTLDFGDPVQLLDGCVLLPVVGSSSAYDNLRSRLLGPACRSHKPHLTLLHPRHAAGKVVDLRALAREPLPRVIRFSVISVIEQVDAGPWCVVERFGSD